MATTPARSPSGRAGRNAVLHAALSLALVVSGGLLLLRPPRALPPGAEVVAWALVAAGCLVGVARWLPRVLGPVLLYDLVTNARRGRYVLFRTLYAAVLLAVLWVVYHEQSSRPAVNVPVGFAKNPGGQWAPIFSGLGPGPVVAFAVPRSTELARFAESFFAAFIAVQLAAVLLFTPAVTAGAVAEEKERRTLDDLLTTDLSGREIIFGKLAARTANLVLLVLTGLPVLALVQLWGGVEPSLVAAGFAVTGLALVSLTSVSMLASVNAGKARHAIVAAYVAVAVYFALAYASRLVLRLPAAAAIPLIEGLPAVTLGAVVEWFSAGTLAGAVNRLETAFRTGVPLAQVTPGIVRDQAAFHLAVGGVCLFLAMRRLRRGARRSRWSARARAVSRRDCRDKSGLWERRGRVDEFGPLGARARVGNRPMLWKELWVERGFSFNRPGRVIAALIIAASLLPAVWILGPSSGQDDRAPIGAGTAAVVRSWYDQGAGVSINQWVRLVGPLVACLTLVGVGVRAAGSVGGERDRQTLDGLLASPVEARTILWAKWLGAVAGARWAWLWLAFVWLVGLLARGLDVVAVPWLLLYTAVVACSFAALGLWFSTACRTTSRATACTVLTIVGISGGPWALWMLSPMVMGAKYLGGNPSAGLAARIELLGLSPPAALTWLSFRTPADVVRALVGARFVEDDPTRTMIALSVALAVYAATTWALLAATGVRFRRQANRQCPMRTLPWPALPAESSVTVR